MLIKAYDKNYLEDVSDNLGTMLEYARGCSFDPRVFWEMFVSSKVAVEIENGNPKYLSGYSDYVEIIINTSPVYERKLSGKLMPADCKVEDDMCYWSGYAVARLQYASGLSFYELNKLVPIQDVFEMYHILHEADIQKFVDMALERIKRKKTETNLKAIRRASLLNAVVLRSVRSKCTNNAETTSTKHKPTRFITWQKRLVVKLKIC